LSSINTGTRVVTRPAGAQALAAEVAVVGSGAAGVIAALTAARLGRSTVLLEAGTAVGGQLVGTLLGTICGLYTNGPAPRRVTFGPAEPMLHALHREGVLLARRALGTIVLQYDEGRCGRWAERALAEAGVTVVTGATLRGVRMEGRRVAALEVATRWGDLLVKVGSVVDASGDAAVAWHAGLPVREPEVPQWGTQMVVLEGFDEGARDEFDGFQVAEVLRAHKEEYGLIREDGFVFAFPGRGIATASLTHMPNPTEPVGATRAMLEGREQADRVLSLLRREFPAALGRATIRAYGQPGVRQTRWIVAAHHLTIEEVRSGHRPVDAIARCSWPVEAHDNAETVSWEVFGPDHIHWIPLRSLLHRDADNLVAAGRCADADTAALASIRVMGPCFAMGEAAAHALDIAGDGSVHDLPSAAVAERVRDNLEREVRDPWCEGV
jgi:hypothetical protein